MANDFVEIGRGSGNPRETQCLSRGTHNPTVVDFRFSFAPGNPSPIGMLGKVAACLNCGIQYEIPPIYGVGKAEDDPTTKPGEK